MYAGGPHGVDNQYGSQYPTYQSKEQVVYNPPINNSDYLVPVTQTLHGSEAQGGSQEGNSFRFHQKAMAYQNYSARTNETTQSLYKKSRRPEHESQQ